MDGPQGLSPRDRKAYAAGLILAATVGSLPVLVLAGAFLGGFLDEAWDSAPWAALGGALLGLVAGSLQIAWAIRKFWK